MATVTILEVVCSVFQHYLHLHFTCHGVHCCGFVRLTLSIQVCACAYGGDGAGLWRVCLNLAGYFFKINFRVDFLVDCYKFCLCDFTLSSASVVYLSVLPYIEYLLCNLFLSREFENVTENIKGFNILGCCFH